MFLPWGGGVTQLTINYFIEKPLKIVRFETMSPRQCSPIAISSFYIQLKSHLSLRFFQSPWKSQEIFIILQKSWSQIQEILLRVIGG